MPSKTDREWKARKDPHKLARATEVHRPRNVYKRINGLTDEDAYELEEWYNACRYRTR